MLRLHIPLKRKYHAYRKKQRAIPFWIIKKRVKKSTKRTTKWMLKRIKRIQVNIDNKN